MKNVKGQTYLVFPSSKVAAVMFLSITNGCASQIVYLFLKHFVLMKRDALPNDMKAIAKKSTVIEFPKK